jgi:hypothetical protein
MVFKKIKQEVSRIKGYLQLKSLKPDLKTVCLPSQDLNLSDVDLTRVAFLYEKLKTDELLNQLLSKLDFDKPTHAAIALLPLLRALEKGKLPGEAARQVELFLENQALDVVVRHAKTHHPSLYERLKKTRQVRLKIVK